MKSIMKTCRLALVLCLALVGCNAPQEQKPADNKNSDAKMDKPMTLAAKIARLAPTEITADTSRLSENDRKALDKIIEAAKLMDDIFLRQVWSGNVDLKKKLAADTTPE